MEFGIVGAIILAILIVFVLLWVKPSRNEIKKDYKEKLNNDDFVKRRQRMYVSCDEKLLDEFMGFLRTYRGGNIRKNKYLGRELGDLKGIYYHVVLPSKKISSQKKEEYRQYIVGLGVQGLDDLSEIRMRDGKLKNQTLNFEEYKRKKSGNIGEQFVRCELDKLDHNEYSQVNGIVLKKDGITKEFDHIIIGKSVIFILETKAYGINNDDAKQRKSVKLLIDENTWTLKKQKYEKTLIDPSKQIKEEDLFIRGILSGAKIRVAVKPILVLANDKAEVIGKEKVGFPIVRIDELIAYIKTHDSEDAISKETRLLIENEIDRYRA